MKIAVALPVAVLALPLSAQSWSQYGALGTPVGVVTTSSRGLLSVAFQSGPSQLLVREHDGNNWMQSNAPTPTPRVEFAMAYDSTRQRVVLFGGRDSGGGARFADTWEWTGTAWQPQLTLSHPAGRSSAMMAYDSVRGRTVLAGGWGVSQFMGDTWEYDSGQWVPAASAANSPGSRIGYSMAYDPNRQRTVLFGGRTLASGTLLNDTWEWSGSAWQLRSVATPPAARWEHAMCFDPIGGGVLLFGGNASSIGSTLLDDAHLWNGSAWVAKLFHQRPTPRAGHQMALDTNLNRIMILGGVTPNDAWIYPGVIQADQGYFGAGCGTLTLGGVLRPVLGSSGVVSLIRDYPFALSYVAVGLSGTSYGPFALPLPLDGFGLPGCFLYHDAALTAHGHCTPVAATEMRFQVAIPNSPVFSGMRMYLQGWAPDFAANPGGLVTSNGMWWVLGNY